MRSLPVPRRQMNWPRACDLRFLISTVGLSVALASFPATAAAPEDPAAPVAKAYEIDIGDAAANGRMPWEGPSREALFSERMAAAFARDERYGRESHSVGLLAFDPFLGRQCCGMSDLKLRIVSRANDKAVVEATFQGYGPQRAEFDTVLERGAWRIDDIREPSSEKKGALDSIAEILNGPHPCGSDVGKPCDWPPSPSPPSAGVASPKTAPAEVVRAMYKIAFKGAADTDASAKGYSDPAFRAAYFTAALRRAADGIDAYNLKFHDEVLDWDPVLSTNGFADPSNFAVRVARSDAKTAEVVAAFGKGKDRAVVAYHFVRDGDAWRVDDLSSAPGATGNDIWSLRKIYDDALAAHGKR